MSTSNRFEIETLARQHQAEIEHQLRLAAQPGNHRSGKGVAATKVNFRVAVVIAVTVGLSLLLSAGLVFTVVSALAVVR